jgi:hypothetical protein
MSITIHSKKGGDWTTYQYLMGGLNPHYGKKNFARKGDVEERGYIPL